MVDKRTSLIERYPHMVYLVNRADDEAIDIVFSVNAMNLVEKCKYKYYPNDIESNNSDIPLEGYSEVYEKDGSHFIKYYTLENPPEWAREGKE
jgi:hypothetical protein